MFTPFSSIKKTTSQKLEQGFCIAREKGVLAIAFVGGWHARQYCVVKLIPKFSSNSDVVTNLLQNELILSTSLKADEVKNVCASFGAKANSLFRKEKRFEKIRSKNDLVHMIHAFHHISICGSKGPWLSSEAEPDATVINCIACQRVMITPPINSRIRYHPLP